MARFQVVRRLLLPLLVLFLAMLPTVGAGAHALLVRSSPEADAEMLVAPSTIEMWFSEPLELAFSTARLIGPSGDELPTGAAVIDSADSTHMTLPLGNLGPGIYMVAWQTLSQIDGHEWYGSFPITVLNPNGSRPAAGAAVALTGGRGELPTAGETVTRWLSLTGSMLIFGSMLFRSLVLPEARTPMLRARSMRPIAMLVEAACIAIVVGSLGQLLLQASRLGGFTNLPGLVLETRVGIVALARILLAVGVLLLVLLGAGKRFSYVVVTGISVVLLLSFSITSHAGAVQGSLFAVSADLVHLVAASAWVGGLALLPILWVTKRAGDDDRELLVAVRRFSVLAGGAIFIVIISGTFLSLVELPDLQSLWQTPYGIVLLVKIVLVVLALAVAFLNNRRVQKTDAGGNLSTQIAFEAGIALTILVAVSLLVQTPTPRSLDVETEPTGASQPFNQITPTDDLNVHLQVDPNESGVNRFWVHLFRDDSSNIGEVQLVRLLLEHRERNLGQTSVDLEPLGQDTFAAEGAYLSQPGLWDLSVYVRRRGVDDVLSPIGVEVNPAPGSQGGLVFWRNPVPGLQPMVLVAGLLIVLGAVPFLWSRYFRGWTIVGFSLIVLGVGAMAIGITREARAEVPLSQRTNPVLPNAESVARGQEIYAEGCLICHGATGKGDGPVGVTLSPRPSDLAIHMVPGIHTDGQLLEWITNGFPNSAMPSFDQAYGEEDRWHVINYIRTFANTEAE